MGFNDIVNYVVFTNPVSDGAIRLTSHLLGCNKANAPVMPPITVVHKCAPLYKLVSEQGPYLKLAALYGAAAVIVGAYGAHKLFPEEGKRDLKPIFETGNRYHFFHSLALLGAPLSRFPYITATLFMIGMTSFSGACYYHSFTGDDTFGYFAPVGGVILVTGWLSFAL